MKTIYLVVGGRVRTATAKIVGDIAEVETKYGPREFGKWFTTEKLAHDSIKRNRESNRILEAEIREIATGEIER